MGVKTIAALCFGLSLALILTIVTPPSHHKTMTEITLMLLGLAYGFSAAVLFLERGR